MIHRRYAWEFTPRIGPLGAVPRCFALDFDIDETRYLQHRAVLRPSEAHRWGGYITAPLPELKLLIARLGGLHQATGLVPRDQADNVLAFVQAAIDYRRDMTDRPGWREHVQCPIETLVERTGDCEDHAILAATILHRLGFVVGLILAPGPASAHCAVGLADPMGRPDGISVFDPLSGRAYAYGEATAHGWRFGQAPPEYRPDSMQVVPVP